MSKFTVPTQAGDIIVTETNEGGNVGIEVRGGGKLLAIIENPMPQKRNFNTYVFGDKKDSFVHKEVVKNDILETANPLLKQAIADVKHALQGQTDYGEKLNDESILVIAERITDEHDYSRYNDQIMSIAEEELG